MVNRIQKLNKNNNLMLFGARGTGKTTLLKDLFKDQKCLWINLLTEEHEQKFGQHPDELSAHLNEVHYDYVIVDEIQKFPKLLDVIHKEIETKRQNKIYFILTGSSARKLKRGSANMLGGRALMYYMYPFTHLEQENKFNLHNTLELGSLPLLQQFKSQEDKEHFLRGYVQNYIKEEVLIEQLIRQIDPFKNFLEIAAQMNGEPVNYSKISKEVNVSDQTVKSFFQILEDTLIGFHLNAFNRSIRKQQKKSPKFYFFDTGVKRALAKQLKVSLIQGTSEYGNAFEHFIVLEIFRLCSYANNDFKLSYLNSKDDVEVDLVIERPGLPDLLIEIKSKSQVSQSDAKAVQSYYSSWDKPCVALVISNDKYKKKYDDVTCQYWEDFFIDYLK